MLKVTEDTYDLLKDTFEDKYSESFKTPQVNLKDELIVYKQEGVVPNEEVVEFFKKQRKNPALITYEKHGVFLRKVTKETESIKQKGSERTLDANASTSAQ